MVPSRDSPIGAALVLLSLVAADVLVKINLF
jgi:hypothetical protein